jgi:AAA domain
MRRFILTGTPGAGKTAILRQLELDGFGVVEEAATDLIAWWLERGVTEPWTQRAFIDAIVDLQRRRQVRAADWESGYTTESICLPVADCIQFSSSKTSELDKKLQLPAETVMLIRERVARLNVCLFCIDIGSVLRNQGLDERGKVRCLRGIQQKSFV